MKNLFTFAPDFMKFCKATYFSLFFLFCFTASFSAGMIQNFHTIVQKSDSTHGKSSSVSNKGESSDTGTTILLEKNENEIEKNLCVQSFLLPFYISFFQFEVSQPTVFFAEPLAEKPTTPIYIEVCNFRI